MADAKISALAAATVALSADEVPVNEAGTSKKLTLQQIEDLLGIHKAQLGSDHAISATAATEVALGATALPAGTYAFTYYLLCQSATTTVSPMFGINFTGTAAVKAFWMDYADASATLLAMTGIADDVGTTALGFAARQAQNAYSTTAPNMGFVAGVAVINSTFLVIIKGVIVVTAVGDLELWHGSETATSTTVKAGSSVVVARTA